MKCGRMKRKACDWDGLWDLIPLSGKWGAAAMGARGRLESAVRHQNGFRELELVVTHSLTTELQKFGSKNLHGLGHGKMEGMQVRSAGQTPGEALRYQTKET